MRKWCIPPLAIQSSYLIIWWLLLYTGATENAGLENAAPADYRDGKRGSSTVWKAEVSVI